MKKIAITFLALCVCFTSVPAQKGTQEISANYSILSTTMMFATLSNIMGSVVTFGLYQPKEIENSADIGITYRYYLSNRFALGGTFMYMNNSYNASFAGKYPIGNGITHFYKFAAEGKLDYYRNNWFSCYGYLGLGFDIINARYTPIENPRDNIPSNEHISEEQDNLMLEKQNNTFPWINFQITPIGLSAGKNFGGFVDLGFGYKGLMNLGLYYKF